MYYGFKLFPEYIIDNDKKNKIPKEDIIVDGQNFIYILTEFFQLNHNINNIYNIFIKHYRKNSEGEVVASGGVFEKETIIEISESSGRLMRILIMLLI